MVSEIILVVAIDLGVGGGVLVAGKFSHGFLGAVIVDERFAGGGCGDERSRGLESAKADSEVGLLLVAVRVPP